MSAFSLYFLVAYHNPLGDAGGLFMLQLLKL